jgi:hypothetical protein
VLRRLAMLDTHLERLAPYRVLDEDAYRQDWKTRTLV